MDISQITVAKHFVAQMQAKGFTQDQVISALTRPEKVTDVTRYPGQKRYCGAGVAVVVDGTHLITLYADGIVTPLREDQKGDPEALRSRRLNG
jgi:hypothetical protein